VKKTLLLGLVVSAVFLIAAKCSREHVESIEMMNRGVKYYSQNLIPQAIRDLNRAVTLDPENEKAHHNLALVYMHNKNYQEAVKHLQKAIALDDSNAQYHYNLGEVFNWMGHFDQALASLEKAVQLDPKLYKAYYWMGRVHDAKDEMQKALEKYSEAIMKGPRFYDAYRELGTLYADLGYLDHAEQVLTEGLKACEGKGDEIAVLQARLGTVYQEKQKYELAIKAFREALAYDPKMEDALFSIGWTYRAMNNPEHAKLWLKKFLEGATQKTRPDYVKAAQDAVTEIEVGTPSIK